MKKSDRNLVIVGVVILALFWAVSSGAIKLTGTGVPGGGTTGTAATLPINVYVQDAFSGNGTSSVVMSILNPTTLQQLESVTAASSGVATSSGTYTSGTPLLLKLALANYVTQYVPFTVPYLQATGTGVTSFPAVTVPFMKNGTAAITVVCNNNGSALTSGGVINITAIGGGSQITLTVTITNTVANTGWNSSRDPTNANILLGQAVKMWDSTAQNLTIGGAATTVQRGTVLYFLQPVSDSAYDKQQIGNYFPTYTGVYSFTVTVNKGSAPTTGEILNFNTLGYFDTSYFSQYGMGNPTLTSGGPVFTLNCTA